MTMSMSVQASSQKPAVVGEPELETATTVDTEDFPGHRPTASVHQCVARELARRRDHLRLIDERKFQILGQAPDLLTGKHDVVLGTQRRFAFNVR
jgi:hypothetical protein